MTSCWRSRPFRSAVSSGTHSVPFWCSGGQIPGVNREIGRLTVVPLFELAKPNNKFLMVMVRNYLGLPCRGTSVD